MILDNSKITVLGLHIAGWSKYCEHLRVSGVNVYTTTDTVYDSNSSIYGKHHPYEALVLKSQNKNKDPKSVESALGHLSMLLFKISEPETRRHLVGYMLSIDNPENMDLDVCMNFIEAQNNPTEAMISYICELTADYDESYLIKENDNELNLTGYTFARSLNRASIEDLFCGKDKKLVKEVREWSGYVNLDTKSIDIQQTLAQSKKMIVDTLQMNLQLLKENKPLIAIHVIVASENEHRVFNPDWKQTIGKVGFVLTNAEIRTIYKLTHELDSPLINSIMKETVSFVKNANNSYVKIPPPWINHEETWQNRARSHHKKAHCEREAHEIQPWLRELMTLSNITSQHLIKNVRSSDTDVNEELINDDAKINNNLT